MTRKELIIQSNFSPHDLLPTKFPKNEEYPYEYFYENVIKYLLKDIIRIMDNGIPINLKQVKIVEDTLNTVLQQVDNILQNNKYIKQFQILQYKNLQQDYIIEQRSKLKSYKDFIKIFNNTDIVHKSYFMNEILKTIKSSLSPPEEKLITGISKWKHNQIKQIASLHPAITLLINKKIKPNNKFAKQAMLALAKDKATLYNKRYYDNITQADTLALPKFNPGSAKQKQELFKWLGIESEKISKLTGLPSYDRDTIEIINKETDDEDIKKLTQALIDYSYSAIVKQNFIEGFYNYTVNGRLQGNIKLFGAKSFRPTSSQPNLLNMPSSKSIYSYPVKECLIAPKGKLIYTIDYSALEDRVIANLTGDKNKILLQTDATLDGHLYHATIYFEKRFKEILGDLQHRELTIAAKKAMDAGNKEIKKLRSLSKNVTFGASYGAYPPKIAATIKCSLEEAEEIFNAYHNTMYPGITKYREEYILKTALKNKRIHLGLGCYIHTDNAHKDIRTLHNASCQFWSILTLLAINKIHQLIDLEKLQDKIEVIATIYDSIYFCINDDPEIIKWLNDRIVTIMCTDFLENQIVKNEAIGEIGLSWAKLYEIPNNASIEDIKNVLKELHE